MYGWWDHPQAALRARWTRCSSLLKPRVENTSRFYHLRRCRKSSLYSRPDRHTYKVQYQSGIQNSGSNSLSVKIIGSSINLQSAEQSFDLTVQPPNPIFLSPPAQVRRTWVLSSQKEEPASLQPDTVPLQILVEFPDQHPRTLKATRLYVNGNLVAENTAEPFDRFDWSIASQEVPYSQHVKGRGNRSNRPERVEQ